MKRLLAALVTVLIPLLAAAACSGESDASGEAAASAADTLTRRQKDSVISTLRLPGAGAVGKALDAADDAAARARAHDTIR